MNTKQIKLAQKMYFPLLKNSTRLLISLALFVVFSNQIAFSAESKTSSSSDNGMDVALVLDTSGSMKKNDPNQLRVQAAKLFVSLLSRQDKVSLIGFSNRAYPITPLLSLNTRKNEKKLLKAIDQMSANGQYTNLHDAIKGGYDLLKNHKSPNRKRHIILMSDGKMDLGNKERNLRLLEDTLEDLTPILARENIKVHTIAFTKDSYIPLLKLAAEDTRGQFIMLKDANGIHQVFENMFERTKLPEMLPLEDDSFVVDKDVKEVTIVASKFKYNTVISIQSPSGDEITLKNRGRNIKWYQARKFDLITIKDPAPGYWLIKYSEGGNKAYIVSDIKLEATTTKQHAEPGAPLHIQAQLKKNNRRITNKSLLNSTQFKVKVTSPVGAVIENPLIDDGSEIGSERKDGIYGISYAFDKQGPYKIEITAKGETFDRKKTLFIDVKSETFKTPFDVQTDALKEPDMLDTIKDGKKSTEKEAPKSADITSGNHAATDVSHNSSAENTHLTNDGQQENTSEHIKLPEVGIDKTMDHEKDNMHRDENNTSPDKTGSENGEHSGDELEADNSFGVKDAVIAFIAFNSFLLILGGGYYFWHRRQQKQKDKDKVVDDDESIESKTEAVTESNESEMELEPEDDLTSSISDLDLEGELSSILENEKNEN